MYSRRLLLPIKDDFAVIDSRFPQRQPKAFRNSEINQYLARIQNMGVYTMYPMKPGKEAWFNHGYGMKGEEFEDNLRGYLEHYPQNTGRIKHIEVGRRYKFKLAYSFFLAETYVLLPFFEENKIPFVFVLYPGGAFGLHNKKSDEMLKKVLSSRFFRGVIATQPATINYLKEKSFCDNSKVHYIYGGFVQFKKKDVLPRRYYGKDKKTLDICFVGHKYSRRGYDKGYDLFIESAKKVCKKADNVYFHVIGGFDEKDIDVSSIKDHIEFHGIQSPEYLREFYRDMDIFISPNRPYQLYEGNFDGFPIGGDAGFCGVARFVSDELNMNRYFRHSEDIVLIPLDSTIIKNEILFYREKPGKLEALAKKGQKKTQELWDVDSHIEKRLSIFSNFVNLRLEDEG